MATYCEPAKERAEVPSWPAVQAGSSPSAAADQPRRPWAPLGPLSATCWPEPSSRLQWATTFGDAAAGAAPQARVASTIASAASLRIRANLEADVRCPATRSDSLAAPAGVGFRGACGVRTCPDGRRVLPGGARIPRRLARIALLVVRRAGRVGRPAAIGPALGRRALAGILLGVLVARALLAGILGGERVAL